jgi:hypothetical protein
MDWIDVGMSNIEIALNEYYSAQSLQKSMKFYNYITCIDIVWEGISQSHRVFFNKEAMPFGGTNCCFSDNPFEYDDNKYFKEVRACFGAHSVNLNSVEKDEKRFASWSYTEGKGDTISIIIYSSIPNKKDTFLTISIDAFQHFFESRYKYIQNIMDQIDTIDKKYYNYFRSSTIETLDDPIAQIDILITENENRLCSEGIRETLNAIKSFLQTDFSCKSNSAVVGNF